MTKGDENRLAERYLCRFRRLAQEFRLEVSDKVKVLTDFTCIKEKDKFKLGLGFAQVDLAISKRVEIDKANKLIKQYFKFIQDAKTDKGFINIPFCILELKTGRGVTSDAIRAREIVANRVKTVFPFCFYVFIGDNTDKRRETLLRHGKSFDQCFIFRNVTTDKQIENIVSDFVRPYLINLRNLSLLT